MELIPLTMNEDVSSIYTSAADTHLLVLHSVLLLVLHSVLLLLQLACPAACSAAYSAAAASCSACSYLLPALLPVGGDMDRSMMVVTERAATGLPSRPEICSSVDNWGSVGSHWLRKEVQIL